MGDGRTLLRLPLHGNGHRASEERRNRHTTTEECSVWESAGCEMCQGWRGDGHEVVMTEPPEPRDERFDGLYSEYRRPVLAYCMRRLDAFDAADVASETFLVAWRRMDELPPPPGTLPYLYAIAHNVIRNQRRAGWRRQRLGARLLGLADDPAPDDPATVVVQNEADQEIRQAVHRLRPKDREIVMLYAWEDVPREVIAQMMGMSRSAVDQRIHRAYRRLARALEPSHAPSQVAPSIVEEGGRS